LDAVSMSMPVLPNEQSPIMFMHSLSGVASLAPMVMPRRASRVDLASPCRFWWIYLVVFETPPHIGEVNALWVRSSFGPLKARPGFPS
jgi:hypothetical protein